ncbi:hypothetical protein LCGC14_3063940, partial [marine sediment metagenome]
HFIDLKQKGVGGELIIKAGYCWDGPSGPAIDTRNFMRGSLIHDALYQLMRMELLDQSMRDAADRTLWRICREDGMWAIRAWWIYKSVHWFAASAADPSHRRALKKMISLRRSITLTRYLRSWILPES